MADFNFQEVFKELTDNIVTLAKISFKQFGTEAATDGKHLLDSMKDKLQRWADLLSKGQITAEDFELLVLGQKDLVEMIALRQAGLAAIKAEQFRNSVVNMIVDTISNVVKL